MSGDEAGVLVVASVLAVFTWFRWYLPLASVRRLGAPAGGRLLLSLAPPLAMAGLYAVLKTLASFDVRDAPLYLLFYLAMGAGWVGCCTLGLPALGLNPRDDVIERGNAAAAPAAAGAVIALTAAFAGGNVGDGPGWWVVVFAAGLATGGLALAWWGLDRVAGVSDTVTIHRDAAAGLRLGAFLAAAGIILGRSVAGDWVSAGATLADFSSVAWPVAVFVAVAALVERVARPTAEAPAPAAAVYGVPFAILYLAAAIIYVLQLGAPA
jgi:hypothetical protein